MTDKQIMFDQSKKELSGLKFHESKGNKFNDNEKKYNKNSNVSRGEIMCVTLSTMVTADFYNAYSCFVKGG